MTSIGPTGSADRGQPGALGSTFVVADPHVVYLDAVMQSPWDHDGGGRLPDKDDWSTYRYTVKDIILGIATHRYNKNTRRLEIRSYFVGEHPIFKELEPTKAMLIVFCCQSYQIGGTLELFFERGVPFDIRELVERHLNIVVSGHQQLLGEEITKPLFASLSDFPVEMQLHIAAQNIAIEMVCYNTYRGTWAPNHVKTLVQRGIPLRWLFQRRPNPVTSPLVYAHLVDHLRAALLEEYAVRRLEDRQMGESLGKRVRRVDDGLRTYYLADEPIRVADEDGTVDLLSGTPFCLAAVVARSTAMIHDLQDQDLIRARELAAGQSWTVVLVVPIDFIYLPDALRTRYMERARGAGVQVMVVGLTMAQLLTEVELALAMTAAEIDPDEVDVLNVDRYPD